MKTINNSEGQGVMTFSECLSHPNHFTTIFDLDKELKMNQDNGTIYIATNLLNGKQYVGQTVQPLSNRLASHKYEAKKKQHTNVFHNAIKKYGIENFKWISFSCPEEDLDWQETFLIKELGTLASNGYNLDSGGNKNKYHHEITKQKMRENHWDCSGEKNPNYGKIFSTEHRKNISKALMGRKLSVKTLDKLKGRIPWNKGFQCPETAGENNPSAILKEKDVILIKKFLIENKYSRKEISKMFNISKSTIHAIAQNRVWKDMGVN
jgi:group I intron endonuclease